MDAAHETGPTSTEQPTKSGEKSNDVRQTKMAIATEIYKRMRKTKGVTRKDIIEQFVAEAKLSQAGASTYYQLIKAKVR